MKANRILLLSAFWRALFLLLVALLSGAAIHTDRSNLVRAHSDAQTPASNSPFKPQPVAGQAQRNPAGLGQTATPLEKLLNPDGTLNTKSGFTGSLDPTGWEMVSGRGEPPRFARSGAQSGNGQVTGKAEAKSRGVI